MSGSEGGLLRDMNCGIIQAVLTLKEIQEISYDNNIADR